MLIDEGRVKRPCFFLYDSKVNNTFSKLSFSASLKTIDYRAKRSPRRWDWGKAHEIRYCYPVGESRVWLKSHLTKA